MEEIIDESKLLKVLSMMLHVSCKSDREKKQGMNKTKFRVVYV